MFSKSILFHFIFGILKSLNIEDRDSTDSFPWLSGELKDLRDRIDLDKKKKEGNMQAQLILCFS